jgi:hypothetical protein
MSHTKSVTPYTRRAARRALAMAFSCALIWSALPTSLQRMVVPSAEAASFTVTNTNDSGAGSLRQAIIDANSNFNSITDTITFNIPISGYQTIKPLTPLPAITSPTIIDGYTQPGTQQNTLAVGSNALILIELNGSLIPEGPDASGLRVHQTGGVTIKGLAINRFRSAGIEIKNSYSQTRIQGNFIGIDVTGTNAIADNPQSRGIDASDCANVLIGGTTPAVRNVISDNGNGIYFGDGANSNAVKGNLIGTNKVGTSAVPNNTGVGMTGSGNVIGGSEAGAGNVISANTGNGVSTSSNGSGGNTIAGNLIGTDASGAAPLGNGYSGIDIYGSNNMIGGTSPGARNVISANSSGVSMRGYAPENYAPSGNVIQGNYIGTDITGQLDFGNEYAGVVVMGPNMVGGASVPEGNRIAFNKVGVIVDRSDDKEEETATAVLSNSIYSNDELGIDLRTGPQTEGVTPNDGFFDLDTGPNGYQNFPVLATATSAAGQTAVAGSLKSKANTTYTIQFFSDDVCDPTGHGEGETFLGSTQVTTDADGAAPINVTLPASVPAGHWVTATATDPLNKTSEFSLSRQVSAEQQQHALSVGDVAVAEGNSGQTDAVFNVTLSPSSNLPVSVNYATANPVASDHAHSGEDYVAAQGTLTFAPGETSKQVAVKVIGDTAPEPDEVFVLQLSNPAGASLADDTSACTINNDDDAPTPTPEPTPAPNAFEFAQSQYTAQEDSSHVTVTVKRTGDTSSEASVDYATQSDTATERGEFTTAVGTLRFAAGETQKTFDILLTEDSHDESDEEQANIVLSNPWGATLGQLSSARLMIADDASEPGMNASDDAELFVRQHYHDFFNREADASGLAFWMGELAQCGADQQCLDAKRQHVSAAFFLSIEFQQTGFLVHRLTRASFAKMPRYRDFVHDARALGEGVVVGQGLWQQQLEQNKQAFVAAWVSRAEFKQKYDGMLNGKYVDALYANAGVVPLASERQQLIDGLDQLTETRGSALLKVAAHPSLVQSEKSPAFVLMQYFGYLRRDPDAAPDSDMSGYNFWLVKLNNHGGDFVAAEMVRSFLLAAEYRSRFGQP